MIFPPQIPNQHFSTSITILKLLGNLWCWWSKDVHSVSWQQYKIFLKDSTEKLTLKFLPQTSIYQVLPRHQVLAEHKTRARECNLCSLFTGQLKQQDIYLSEEALQIAVKRREAKSKEEKERLYPFECRFQRMARTDKNAFLRDQCKK